MMIPRLAMAMTLSAACLVSTTKLQAQNVPPNPYQYQFEPYHGGPFYIGVDVGPTIMQDINVKNLGGTMTLDTGVRADIIFGYQFCDPLAVEFETGSIWNEVSSVSGTSISSLGERADLYQIPFLANLVYRVPLSDCFSLYIGAGAGGVATEFDLRQSGDDFFSDRHHDSDTDFTFAYQGKTGVKYCIMPHMEVDLSYKFLGTLDHKFFNDDPNLFLKTSNAYSHSFLASFTWRF